MRNIYFYECRRLLFHKVFWCLLAILIWYGHQTLFGTVISGVANTAPFSPWSFGSYLSTVLPFLCIGELFFLTFFTSGRERRAAALTAATPADPRRYALVRCGAVLTGAALMALCVVGMGLWFYARYFRWTDFGTLIAPALLSLLPAMLFVLGAGWFLGRLHPALPYVLMAAVFLLPYLPIPDALDLIGGGFYLHYPQSLGVLDPPFSVPPSVLLGRSVLLLLGVLLTTVVVLPQAGRSSKTKNMST